MTKPDHCICPDCRAELVVEMYGHNLECSECGCELAVFTDSAIQVDIKTPFWSGTLWLSLLGE